ncbi:DUF354 domain-containing protein [bacterium]|nr:DUF354 domain-containing protein [bacterium]
MRIIIDIGHPAHVHLFRHFAVEMSSRGNQVLFSVREKENEVLLIKSYGFNYVSVGKHYRSPAGKAYGLILSVFRMLIVAGSFKPDLYLSHGSIIAALTSWLTRKPHISMEDTGNPEQVRLYLPFTEAVLTSNSFHRDYGRKQIRYKGFHELAYLHPSRFTADPGFRNKLGVSPAEKLVILRFVAWGASHDRGMSGLPDREKEELVLAISGKATVFISSEKPLPPVLDGYRYPLPPDTIHQALAAADLFIGEGATMASECAVLGTPAIYINPQSAGTINEQSGYGLLFQYRDFQSAAGKIEEIIEMQNARDYFIAAREALLKDKIDLTAFLVWFITNWPESMKTIKENPGYPDRFKTVT